MFPLTRFLLFLTSNPNPMVFCIKQKCFITNDGISVTFLLENGVKQNETFSYSTLFVTRRKYDYPKTSFALFMLLAGDVEVNPGPSLYENINFHSSTKGLKLFHLNIRSLHAKFDEVREILLSCKKVDIFGFTETFLTDTTSYEIPGFTLITRNRTSGSGGGVCVYVRDEINFELREDLHGDNVEGIFY